MMTPFESAVRSSLEGSHGDRVPVRDDHRATALHHYAGLNFCNIEDRRAAERAREKGKPAAERKAKGRLVQGQVVTNWKQALAQLAAAYPDRINPYL